MENNKIIEYLKKAEGNKLHKNATESDVTSHLGIYKKHHKDADFWSIYSQIEQELGVSMYTGEGRKEINEYIKSNNYIEEELHNSIYVYYIKNFSDQRVIERLSEKTQMTYFSLCVNAGNRRANKILQASVNSIFEEFQVPSKIGVDGIVGRGTLQGIEEAMEYGGDDMFNDFLLINMGKFYNYLITKNVTKYGIYKKGWFNRLVGLNPTDEGIIKIREAMHL
jgi:hypothetical protein